MVVEEITKDVNVSVLIGRMRGADLDRRHDTQARKALGRRKGLVDPLGRIMV